MKEIQINVPNQVVISLIPIIILISYLQYKVKLNQSVTGTGKPKITTGLKTSGSQFTEIMLLNV